MMNPNSLSLRPCLLGLFFLLAGVNLSAQTPEPRFVMTQLGPSNLVDNPNDLNIGPDGMLWLSERDRGVLVRLDTATASRDELVTIPNVLSTSRQEGLMGFDFHPQFGDFPFVYLTYTFEANGAKYQRLARYEFSETGRNGSLSNELILLDSLPATNDHNSGRLVIGPDEKIYYTIGDLGGNQGRNWCNLIRSQELPTQAEVDAADWTNYPGSVLRMELDGSIPTDNPELNGVRSHIYSYGHRNPQGLSFSESGLLYSSEHGPDTDDEVNLIEAGNNYGWPIVVGFRDDQAYDYCNWSAAANCPDLNFDNSTCPDDVTPVEENTLTDANYREPLASLFAVTDDYNFNDPAFESSYWARPNVAPPSLEVYDSDAIPGWKGSLLVPSLKRGRIYRLKLSADGRSVVGDTIQHFYTPNRYRDIAISPDGRSIYVVTDESGNVSDLSGRRRANPNRRNPATILRFTLDESSSANDLPAAQAFSLTPNPAEAVVQLSLGAELGAEATAQLLSVTGSTIRYFGRLNATDEQLDLSGVPAGLYLVRVVAGHRHWEQRLVVR